MKHVTSLAIAATAFALVLGLQQLSLEAQAQPPAPAGRAAATPTAKPAPDPTKPQKLDLADGTTARYRVREQLAGINFPSDAVGSTTAVTGTIVVNADGTIDGTRSKISVDLRTLTSDQQMRDGYVQRNTLETERYPSLEFVPRRAVGLPVPFPSTPPAQAGFQLVGDLTLHGVTNEATWNVIATFSPDEVSGRATTTLLFTTYKIAKPSLARLLSVDDKIELEVQFKSKRSTP